MEILFSQKEAAIRDQIKRLKEQAGSHSPSFFTLVQKIPGINVKVDACFLSNPYATKLFLEYFMREISDPYKIQKLIECYPSQNAVIAELLAEHIGVPPGKIFVGNGATEIIQAILHNFVSGKVLINIPTFSPYYEFLKPGTEVIYNLLKKEENFKLDIERFIDVIERESPDTIVLINPNNPDGGYVRQEDIRVILTAAKRARNIIIDESFIHFAFEDSKFEAVSNYHFIHEYDNLILVKSMSKDFGIAGVRAGYGVMREDNVHALLKNGYLWNSNGLAEYFFQLYTRSDFLEKYEEVRKRYIREIQEFVEGLRSINGIKVYPTWANFVLIELPNGMKAADVADVLLLRYGIYVRNCDDKIGLDSSFIRIASRTEAENEYILASLREIFHDGTR